MTDQLDIFHQPALPDPGDDRLASSTDPDRRRRKPNGAPQSK